MGQFQEDFDRAITAGSLEEFERELLAIPGG
jgi:hypothetical protein